VVSSTRYLVYGVTGSGKTRLAGRIAERTGLPNHHMDDLTWRPGWVPVPDDEQRAIVHELCDGDRWVLDHAYGSWRDIPLARAEIVVALDYPRWLSLSRLLRRTVRRIITQETVCGGNRESWRLSISRDSIIVWHFRSFASKRARIRSWVAEGPGPRIVHLRSQRETDAWLSTLAPTAGWDDQTAD